LVAVDKQLLIIFLHFFIHFYFTNLMNITKNSVEQLLHQLDGLNISSFIQLLTEKYPDQVTFSTSFSFEDQAITHEILSKQLPVKIFTLDTGRMFAETYSVWNSTNEAFKTHIKAYYPNQDGLEKFVESNGPNSFYESVENRKACCFIRKVEPLKLALAGNAPVTNVQQDFPDTFPTMRSSPVASISAASHFTIYVNAATRAATNLQASNTSPSNAWWISQNNNIGASVALTLYASNASAFLAYSSEL
jgi:hypothetical protein